MEYRHLGKSGLRVSEICLGSWLTYGGATDDQVANSCIEKAYDLGINFFDTSNVYATGKAEEVVGKALSRYPRDSYVLATKVFFPMGDRPTDRGLSRKHIIEQCHRSLHRLGTDYIDLYQCHRYDRETPLEETLRALDDLITQGKVLYIGFSEWSPAQIIEALEMQRRLNFDRFISNQPYYNILGRNIEREVMPLCWREGIGQIVYSPLAQGVLTGKYRPGEPPPSGSRAADPEQNMFMNQGKLDDAQLEKVQKLIPIARECNLTMPQLAIAWCLRREEVSSAIIGASRPSQVEENAAASGSKFSEETLKAVDEALK
ncbi:MAG: aldo/keto reductase family protein [Armatimonadetes bacterium]|nr:aldo/keto reductase family protein [Armatimonadota bacterium]